MSELLPSPVQETELTVTQKEKINRYQHFLELVYEHILSGDKQGMKMKTKTTEASVGTSAGIAIIEIGYATNSAKGGEDPEWTWNVDKPNRQMAIALIEKAKQIDKDYRATQNSKGAGRKSGSKNKPKTPTNLGGGSGIKPEVTAKYKEFLDAVYSIMKGVKKPILATKLNLRDKMANWKLDAYTVKALVSLNILERSGTSAHTFAYKWVAGKPTNDMASATHVETRTHSNSANKKTIKPKEEKKTRGPYKKSPDILTEAVKPKKEIKSNADAWKQVAHKAIDMDDPHLALLALNKMK